MFPRYVTLLLPFVMILTIGNGALQFDAAIEKRSFKNYFVKSCTLRFYDSNMNITRSANNATKAPSRLLSKRSLMDGEKLLVKAYERLQVRSKLEKFQKVSRNGTTEQKLDIISEEIWDRVGGELIEKTLIATGSLVGSRMGGYVGGTMGMAIGVMVPPLQIPLVIGGVFVGQNFGRILGAIGGKIASDFLNNFIADNVVGKLIVHKLYSMITGDILIASKSIKVTCRSDICLSGSAQSKCKCVACKGPMYSDKNGLSSCKSCKLGSYTITNYYRRNIGCRNCRRGSIGKSDGKCYKCDGPMEYGDKEGATSCKTCPLGKFPFHDYTQLNIGCKFCRKGAIGKNDGKCYNCDGPMEYGDKEGATSCKTCPLGKVPFYDYTQLNVGCKFCRKGAIGKNDGKCYKCDGPMEYGDKEGATSCKTCSLGKVPKLDYNRLHVGCRSCSKSMFGKSDGKCYKCDGPMEYGDKEGATSCKKCSLGTVPKLDYNRRHVGCRSCSKSMFGKSDGKCYKCDGPMEYGNKEGATSCKKCSLGTVPKLDYNRRHVGCRSCRKSMFGKSDGKCHISK